MGDLAHCGNVWPRDEDYVRAVEQEKIWDPTLSFQLNRGFNVVRVVSDYLKHDPESLGCAALSEWKNPEAVEWAGSGPGSSGSAPALRQAWIQGLSKQAK